MLPLESFYHYRLGEPSYTTADMAKSMHRLNRISISRAVGKFEVHFLMGKPPQNNTLGTGRMNGPEVLSHHSFCNHIHDSGTVKWVACSSQGSIRHL